jgi:hypothetical protein
MELDDLKSAWAQQNRRLDQVEALALEAWREPRRRDVRKRLRAFGRWQLLWLLVWIVVTALAASFWVQHRQVPHLLLTGLALHLYGIAAIWVSITRALLAIRLQRTPVPVLQQLTRLAQLRRFTAITELALGLPWACLWLLATQWLCVQWLGLDLYAMAPRWFLATLGTGLAAAVTGSVLAHRALHRVPASHWLHRGFEALSGRSLARAQQELRELQDPLR